MAVVFTGDPQDVGPRWIRRRYSCQIENQKDRDGWQLNRSNRHEEFFHWKAEYWHLGTIVIAGTTFNEGLHPNENEIFTDTGACGTACWSAQRDSFTVPLSRTDASLIW